MGPKTIVSTLGVILVLLGLLGFVLGSPLFGMFEVNNALNFFHLITGILALIIVGMGEGATLTLARVFGAIFALAGIIAFILPGGSLFGFLSLNMPDSILYIIFGAFLLYAGFSRSVSVSDEAAMSH